MRRHAGIVGPTSMTSGEGSLILLTALDAFDDSVARCQRTLIGRSTPKTFAALTECLWWAVFLDESFRSIEGQPYRTRRDADPDGRLLRAVNWAMNRPGHDQTMVFVSGAAGEGSDVIWRPVDDLPFARTRGGQAPPFGRKDYRRWLERRPVHDTVGALHRWFVGGARATPMLDGARLYQRNEPDGDGSD